MLWSPAWPPVAPGSMPLTVLRSALPPGLPSGDSVDTVKSLGSSQSRIFDSLIRDSSFLLAMCSTRFRWVEACNSHRPGPASVPSPAGSSSSTPQDLGQGRRACWEPGRLGLSQRLWLQPPSYATGRFLQPHCPPVAHGRHAIRPGCRQCRAGLNPALESSLLQLHHAARGDPAEHSQGAWPTGPRVRGSVPPAATLDSAAPGLESPVSSDGQGRDSTWLAMPGRWPASPPGSLLPGAVPGVTLMNLDPTGAQPGPWASKRSGPGLERVQEDLTEPGLPSPWAKHGHSEAGEITASGPKQSAARRGFPARLSSHPAGPAGRNAAFTAPEPGLLRAGP